MPSCLVICGSFGADCILGCEVDIVTLYHIGITKYRLAEPDVGRP